jgi:hypothetical protein
VRPEDSGVTAIVFGRKTRELSPGHDSLVTSAATRSKLVATLVRSH